MSNVKTEITKRQVVLITYGPEPGEFKANVDSVLARCGGVFSKADYTLPPIGMLSCASTLESGDGKKFISAEVVDLATENLYGEQAQLRLEKVGGEILVSSPATATLDRDLAFSIAWQKRKEGRWLVFVGTHATVETDSLLQGERLAVIRGEPEFVLLELCQALLEHHSPGNIAAVSYCLNQKIVHNPGAEQLGDINRLPIPDRRWIAANQYNPPFARPGKFDLIISSRGCPFSCSFCASGSYYGQKVRYRSVELVLAEVKELVEKWDIRNIGFWDDTFTLDRKRVIEICEGLKEIEGRVEWICLARVDTVDPELLGIMADAGCYQIQYGVESGSERMLKVIGKNCSLDQIKSAFLASRAAGIETVGFFMFGIPGETAAEGRQTLELAKELKPDFVSFNVCTPLPGSSLYLEMKDNWQAEGNKFWKDMNARCPGAWIGNEQDEKELAKLVKEAYRSFYLRPQFIWKQICRVRSWGQLVILSRAGWAVMRNSL